MKKYWIAACCGAGALLLSAAFAQQIKPASSSEYPAPLVREEQKLVVDGITETWSLEWTKPPKPICEPSDVSLTCPCTGFAYGEGGDLKLIRLRKRVEIDQLQITPFFDAQFPDDGRIAIVKRWQPDYAADFRLALEDDFPALVATRPVVQVMHFADYDHDGRPTEFFLQTGTDPCGKRVGVVLGVSKLNARLHAFGTVSTPGRPLYLQKETWEALRDASSPVETTTWSCGDHGAGTQTTVRLRWSAAGIDGELREFTCPPEPKRLLSEEPLR